MECSCRFCKKYGKSSATACGGLVTHPINNCVKATELLNKHDKSEWHLASVEAHVVAVYKQERRCCRNDGLCQ